MIRNASKFCFVYVVLNTDLDIEHSLISSLQFRYIYLVLYKKTIVITTKNTINQPKAALLLQDALFFPIA